MTHPETVAREQRLQRPPEAPNYLAWHRAGTCSPWRVVALAPTEELAFAQAVRLKLGGDLLLTHDDAAQP